MTSLTVLQPSYLPWIGYFDQIEATDIFVFYDDVQFDKGGWRNRNRIKGKQGPIWLTVPVLQKGRMGQNINDVQISNIENWAHKHLMTIHQSYVRAPFTSNYFDELSKFLSQNWNELAELDIELITLICKWLGLTTPMYRASKLNIGGDRNERLLNLCNYFGVDRYISGSSARDYLDVTLFEKYGVKIELQDYKHPEYNQLFGQFTPYMSIIDLLFNKGPESLAIIRT